MQGGTDKRVLRVCGVEVKSKATSEVVKSEATSEVQNGEHYGTDKRVLRVCGVEVKRYKVGSTRGPTNAYYEFVGWR